MFWFPQAWMQSHLLPSIFLCGCLSFFAGPYFLGLLSSFAIYLLCSLVNPCCTVTLIST
ncbi:hypothetical protein C8R41DRAFT_380649 [Lentinula lateritia]|uniref:Uncharacterized protein n=1 Tax=Lentinula lateritia TaxID=40482 RepID=A0ABQ8VFB9_9AGAR|nr:hypothetical protein C8R41DRAFT_380649 [Lentinula lateritia]